VNLLDNAAQMGANPTPAKKKRPGALPGNVRAHEGRAAPARPSPSSALPGNARVIDQQAAARAANLANLPPALSREDRMAIIGQAAMQAGTAHGHVVASAAARLGPDGIRDDAKQGLLQDLARALGVSLGGFATGMRRAAEATPASRGVLGTLRAGFGPGLGPLGALAATQEPPTDQEIQLAGRDQPSEAYAIRRVGPTQPAGARAVMDALDQELTARAKTEVARARGQTAGQAAPKGSPGSRLSTGDLRWLSELTINTDPSKFAVGQAAADLLRRRKTAATTRDLFDLAWRRIWRQLQRPSTF